MDVNMDSSQQERKTKGKPLNKAWYGLTNDITFAKGIEAICNCKECQRNHVQVAGRDTKITEKYTPQLAEKIQQLFKERAHRVMKRNCIHED